MRHPAIDLMSDRTGVLIMKRPVVGLSLRMIEALRACSENERGLALVTPIESRLTLPLRLALGPGSQWVIHRVGEESYDGFTGAVVAWDGNDFIPVGERRHPDFVREAPPEGLQVLVNATVRHPATEELLVGTLAETLCAALSGDLPGGWGLSEPAASPWEIEALSGLCRARAPEPTWLVVVGRADAARRVIGTIEVSRAPSGVEESVRIGVGVPAGEEPPDVRALAERIARRFALVSLMAQATPGPPDLLTEPYSGASPAPIGLAVGAEAVREIDEPGVPLAGGGAWYEVGDGRTPQAWERFGALMSGAPTDAL